MITPGYPDQPSRLGNGILAALCTLIGLFLIAPSLIVVLMSFSSAELLEFPPTGYSMRWYVNFFSLPEWRAAATNSIIVALGTTLVATVLGTMAALGLVRWTYPGKKLISALLLTPMVAPVIVSAVAMYGWYAQLRLVGTLTGLITAHSILALPFVVINVAAVLQRADWRLPQAASSLGASPVWAFLLITAPMVAPGIAAGALFAFITSFDDVVAALFLSGTRAETLPVRMWAGIRFELNPTIAAVSTLLIIFSAVAFSFFELMRRRSVAGQGK
jgi:putative spermidine/putrescine transport system permease protein